MKRKYWKNSAKRLKDVLKVLEFKQKISLDSFALFVNDGSHDSTWSIICSLHEMDSQFKGLNLAHNVGHQYAILAEMIVAKDLSDGL